MTEQTRNELVSKLEELKGKETKAWEALKEAEEAIELAQLKAGREQKSKEWHSIHMAMEGIKALLALEGK